ncbi:hypothetical protein MMC11_004387 [Xylographa trunciseda]|nr:hypothetical protein [Xylographa trunciseda]
MAAFATEFPSIIDLCPGTDLIFWTTNLKTADAQRLTKPWQRSVSLIPNPFQPDKTVVEVKRHPITNKEVIYPQHNPTSMPDPTPRSITDPDGDHAELDNVVRIVLTMHGTFKHDFAYIVTYFHKLGHKDVNLAFVRTIWDMYKDAAKYGDGFVSGLALRWPVERAQAAMRAD